MVVLCAFSMTILINSWAVKANPQGWEWHKPIPCFGCHGEVLSASTGGSEQDCEGCHEYKIPGAGFNVPLLMTQHNPNICTLCHMGNTLVNGTDREIFHNGHNNVKCNQCHTEDNFTVIKIESNGFRCVSCHGNNVHSIHIKNIDKICPTCHGSWARDKTYNPNATISSVDSRRNANLEKFTIYNMIRNLFNAILGGNVYG